VERELEDAIKAEILLKKAALDSILVLLEGMEFSQEEGSIERHVAEATLALKEARRTYREWLAKEGD
jgi:hypothetical protein